VAVVHLRHDLNEPTPILMRLMFAAIGMLLAGRHHALAGSGLCASGVLTLYFDGWRRFVLRSPRLTPAEFGPVSRRQDADIFLFAWCFHAFDRCRVRWWW
jgi:hypothetical protein